MKKKEKEEKEEADKNVEVHLLGQFFFVDLKTVLAIDDFFVARRRDDKSRICTIEDHTGKLL